ncbi:LysR family transcriptional regulator [Dendrosporobacter sp. 1207_IL3150]|uniref:LysR family transcriptional regulator n=1 Tax=Dendrosporobacter sp. 1207_IL3150 TaxID=3084054 RepID=UPI002FD939EF
MDLRLLKTFLSVAKTENITQSAQEINFSQPTVTAQIRALEEHFGVLLFERVGKKLYITEAGKCLISYAERLLTIHREAQAALQELTYDKTVRIGLGTAVAAHTLSPILQEFQQKLPNIAVSIEHCFDLPITVKGILDNSFDFAMVHDEIIHNRILQFNVALQNLVWVACPYLVEKYGNDVWRHPFIALKQGSIYRKIYDEILRENGIRPVLEYSDSEAIRQAVINGLGVGILPEVLVRDSLNDGTLVEFKEVPKLKSVFSVIFHKEKRFTNATQTLLTMIAVRANLKSSLLGYLQSL